MQNVTLTISKDEIMSDVTSIAHVVGRRLYTAETAEKAADIQTPEEGADKYIVARAMAEALSFSRAECARYLTKGRLSDDNGLENVTGNYVIELSMPDRWNISATTKLTSLIHNHAVNYCVYSIFEKTNPDEAANYLSKSNVELSQIKGVLELRTAPVRREGQLY